MFTVLGRKFKFSAQDSDLEYLEFIFMPFWYFGSEGTERGMYEYFGRNELGQNKVQEFKVIFSAQGTLDTFFCDQKLHPPYNIPKHSYFT